MSVSFEHVNNECPEWLHQLQATYIAQLLRNPEMNMPTPMKEKLPDSVDVEQANWVASLSAEPQLWKLGPNHVKEVRSERNRLDAWWNSRSERLKKAVLSRRSSAAPIAAEFRGEFEALGVGGEVICDVGPMGPFRPSNLVKSYLLAID